MTAGHGRMNAADTEIIDLTPENIADYGVCGYKDVDKHLELRKKIAWFTAYHPKGLRIKALLSQEGGYQGMLEYIPGEYAHRPVNAKGYMFIHCLFVGFKKDYKGKGHASALIAECIEEAKGAAMKGVAVVTRKGPFMAKRDIFIKKGFEVVDTAEPDFELLVLKSDKRAADASFKDLGGFLKKYRRGLFILRSPQCPYTEKNVRAIVASARETFDLEAEIIDLEDAEAAQSSPCAFGTFCIVHDGEVISHHPISNARFGNIMRGRKK